MVADDLCCVDGWCWIPVGSSWMNRAKGLAEECPGDPTHRRHEQKPKGPQGVKMEQRGPSICVCESVREKVHDCVHANV